MSLDLLMELGSELLISGIALLDSLPDYVRAMLAATVLVVFLRFFEIRIPDEDVQLSEAFCKSSLVAMITIPLAVWLLPAYRMVVFVDVLPVAAPHQHPGWMLLATVWSVGLFISLYALIAARRKTRQSLEILEIPQQERLQTRLVHWQRRLGMPQALTLGLVKGAQPRNLNGRHRIGFPAAALHWPTSAQDILIIHALCRINHHHNRWYLVAQLMSCCYWPITWVPTLQQRMLRTFQLTTQGLAESCFLDPMGYRNAARQVEQRLPAPSSAERGDDAVEPAEALIPRLQRFLNSASRYIDDLRRLLQPTSEIAWQSDVGVNGLRALRWAEPYDKVFLRVGQAVFFAVLLTGVTLKETPPVVEFEARGWLEVNWMDQFFRKPSQDDGHRKPDLPLAK